MKLNNSMQVARRGPRASIRCLEYPAKRAQSGLTLVELLVAMTISTVITIAALSALIISRQGFTAVDVASQLRDNARFTTDLLQRLAVQAGYQDVQFITNPLVGAVGIPIAPPPNISGFNNALASASDPTNVSTARPIGPTRDGSDILILRYQASETFPGSGVSDNTMIDCAGNPSTSLPLDPSDRVLSVLHVQVNQGEPSLMCTTVNPTTGIFTVQPVIQGVENFQVLYGVDNVTPNTAPVAGATTDEVPDRFLRADQMTVAGNALGTNANWARVRSIRVGMVLRGPPGSAQDNVALTFFPLGRAKNSSGGAVGSAMASANDPGTTFQPGADGRLRQALTFTIHLRNSQRL